MSSVVPFSTEDEAVAMANDTRVGLAGYFYTKDLARAWRVAEVHIMPFLQFSRMFFSPLISDFHLLYVCPSVIVLSECTNILPYDLLCSQIV